MPRLLFPGLRRHDLDHGCRDFASEGQVRVDEHGRGLHVRDVLHDVTHLQGHEGDDAARRSLLALRSLLVLGTHFRHHLGPRDEGKV